jgi:hypothetical protein
MRCKTSWAPSKQQISGGNERKARARANAGVLRCAQDDGEKQTTARTTATATAKAKAKAKAKEEADSQRE